MLPSFDWIRQYGFACNVWIDVLPVSSCQALVGWLVGVADQAMRLGIPDRSERLGTAERPCELAYAADVIHNAQVRLRDVGVLVAVTLRTVVVALDRLDRQRSRMRDGVFVDRRGRELLAEMVAFAFLYGALKFEWVERSTQDAGVVDLRVSLHGLMDVFASSDVGGRRELPLSPSDRSELSARADMLFLWASD